MSVQAVLLIQQGGFLIGGDNVGGRGSNFGGAKHNSGDAGKHLPGTVGEFAPLNHDMNKITSFIRHETGMSQAKAEESAKAIVGFTGSAYKTMRKNPNSKESRAAEKYIAKARPYKGVVHRGVAMSDAEVKDLYIGHKISQHGLASWSTNRSVSVRFAKSNVSAAKPNKVVFICNNNKSGVPIRHMSQFPHEHEVLLSNKARHVVKSAKKHGDILYVTVEEV